MAIFSPVKEAEAVGRLESLMGAGRGELAATGTVDAAPKARSAGRSSCDTKRYVVDTTPDDQDADAATLTLAKNPLNSTALYDSALPVTMLYDKSAPLAQLAEQLTLNQ